MQDVEDRPVWHPIHRSLIRPDLVAGCERTPLVFLIAAAFIFIVILQKPIIIAFGIMMVVGGFPLLRMLAKRDPMMYRVWTRHFGYQSHYPAHPSLARPAPRVNVSPGSIIEHQHKKGSTA